MGWLPPSYAPYHYSENDSSPLTRENLGVVSHADDDVGSSPLTRGKRGRRLYGRAGVGLIPTHAGKTNDDYPQCIATTAHPRSRGENAARVAASPGPAGSSPLARGKSGALPPRSLGGGLIPTHAGKTTAASTGRRTSRAHPRSRRENPHQGYVEVYAQGSSPLTRGKRFRRGRRPVMPRLIPAHAGKIQRMPLLRVLVWAHPRSRGENLASYGATITAMGSSPLTRGKLLRVVEAHRGGRFIPAHAGKTPCRARRGLGLRAHPRSRGENNKSQIGSHTPLGSSPPARGKCTLSGAACAPGRFIPARAGKTGGARCRSCARWAHPRSRGENVDGERETVEEWGSSPLTRGKLRAQDRAAHHLGLIPARAGKTLQGCACFGVRRAHPRAGGENIAAAERARHDVGSSPRGRGKLCVRLPRRQGRGLIPARAGKTSSLPTRHWRPWAHPRAGGKPSRRWWCRRNVGLIPARAGKTPLLRARLEPARAHPRAGGENAGRVLDAAGFQGSSPRGRGKRVPLAGETDHLGLIPARAGKTRRPRSRRGDAWAHPRAGGENAPNSVPSSWYSGSSPLTRGKRGCRGRASRLSGLIPAHAGKTLRS